MNKARIAENTIAPEPTDRPYVPQNRPLGPLFRQTVVILPVATNMGFRARFCGSQRPSIPACRNASTETNEQHGSEPAQRQ